LEIWNLDSREATGTLENEMISTRAGTMILICPAAVVDWNPSEEIKAERASRETNCALWV
jgi:hypothetical protein